MALTKIRGVGLESLTDGVTITTADNTAQLTLTSTDADVNEGPVLDLYRNSASPADDDNGPRIKFTGKNDAGQDVEYTRLRFNISDMTDGTEDGQTDFAIMTNGSLQNVFNFNATEAVFNDGSVDRDFRVETNATANAFLVNGGDNQIEINTAVVMKGADTGTNNLASSEVGINMRNTSDTDNNHAAIQFQNASGFMVAKFGANFSDAGNRNTELYFATRANSGNLTEHFRIASNGDLTGTDTSIGSNSDQRLKTNITDYSYSMATFKQYKPKTFNWKNPKQHGSKSNQRGFLAQEIKALDTHWVGELKLGVANLDYNLITEDSDGDRISLTSKFGEKDAMYISIIQQLEARNTALEDA